ncbi:MAG: sarcosine oxidase subunit beta family protein [Alphaproteobacteria bacterium]|nr:sarcosine oxidase subunit beta family protein [Alphaproteobacteria bacterium]
MPRLAYSAFSLLRQGLNRHRGWPAAWRTPEPKAHYAAIVVGGGGHGLATAYYLARNHGVTDVAVLERGWLGGGNTGRNTTVVRSNYYFPASGALYDLALKLYEGLSRDLNFNIMLSQRGMLMLAHSAHELEFARRTVNAIRRNGIDCTLLDRDQVRRRLPILDMSPDARFPVVGGYRQARAGVARHDAVAWGYARAADARGVDIIQNCEVLGFIFEGGRVVGVETSRGAIRADRVGLAVAGHSGVLAAKAGFRLPITSYALQAFVSEPIKPILHEVVLSSATGVYVSQSDKGELVVGGGLDLHPSYSQRGNLPVVEGVMSGLVGMFPCFANLRMMRSWGGIVDVVHDSSPIIGPAPVPGLYLDCGWGTGGFKAIPAGGTLLAHVMATGEQHPIARPFGLERFRTGALVDEAAASGIAH